MEKMCHIKISIFLLANLILTHCQIVNPCDQFSSIAPNVPNASLERCPQAKFMAEDEYECYDKEYKIYR